MLWIKTIILVGKVVLSAWFRVKVTTVTTADHWENENIREILERLCHEMDKTKHSNDKNKEAWACWRTVPRVLTFLVESFPAELADERLVSGVDACVRVEGGAPIEGFPALVALVRFFLQQ